MSIAKVYEKHDIQSCHLNIDYKIKSVLWELKIERLLSQLQGYNKLVNELTKKIKHVMI